MTRRHVMVALGVTSDKNELRAIFSDGVNS